MSTLSEDPLDWLAGLRTLPPFPWVASLILALRDLSNSIAKLVPPETVNYFKDPPAPTTAPPSEFPKSTDPLSPKAPSPNELAEATTEEAKGKEKESAGEDKEGEDDEHQSLILAEQVITATTGLASLKSQGLLLCNPMVTVLPLFFSPC